MRHFTYIQIFFTPGAIYNRECGALEVSDEEKVAEIVSNQDRVDNEYVGIERPLEFAPIEAKNAMEDCKNGEELC